MFESLLGSKQRVKKYYHTARPQEDTGAAMNER